MSALTRPDRHHHIQLFEEIQNFMSIKLSHIHQSIIVYRDRQCGFFCLLGRDQKIEMKLGCENIMSQNTIVQRIGLIESLTF